MGYIKNIADDLGVLKGCFVWFEKQGRFTRALFLLFCFTLSLGVSIYALSEIRWAELVSKSTKNLVNNGDFELPFDDVASGWGTGSYEKKYEDLSKVRPAVFWIMGKSEAKISGVRDYRRHLNGNASFRIENNHGQEDHVFGTLSQRIKVEPHSEYLFSFAMQASENSADGVINVSLYPDEWQERIQPDKVTSDNRTRWRQIKKVISTYEYQDLEVRFISEDKGTVWIDDINLKPLNTALYNLRWFAIGSPLLTISIFIFLLIKPKDVQKSRDSLQSKEISEAIRVTRTFKGNYSLGEIFNCSTEDIIDLVIRLKYVDKAGTKQSYEAKAINSFEEPLKATPFVCQSLKKGEIKHIIDFPRVSLTVFISGKLSHSNNIFSQQVFIEPIKDIKKGDSEILEREYNIDQLKCRVYTREKSFALRYQQKIYCRIYCSIHGNELISKRKFAQAQLTTVYFCPIRNCQGMIRDAYEEVEARAKSYFIKELENLNPK